MDNSSFELLNQKFKAIQKEYFEVKKSFNTFIYEIAQINIWLFLSTVGVAGISDNAYKSWALIMTGVFFIYQIAIFNRLKIGHQVNKDHLAILGEELDTITSEFKKIGYEKSGSINNKNGYKELNYFWVIFFPIFINWGFYMYILSTHFTTMFTKI